jgi:hypothetical protein
MERCAENPISDFLIVNHDARLGQESDEAIRDTKLCGGLPTIVCSTGTPKIKLCTVSFEPSHVLNYSDNGNATCADRTNECVVNVNVNNHSVIRFLSGSTSQRNPGVGSVDVLGRSSCGIWLKHSILVSRVISGQRLKLAEQDFS